jgi:methionyl aminopeptidase
LLVLLLLLLTCHFFWGVREVLDEAGRAVRVGITTDEIDEIVHNECIKRGAYPSPLRYKGFPKSCCTSVNEVACHGIPDSYKLQDGDIINIDVTVFHKGFHGDCSETYAVGNVLPRFKKLMKAAYDAMMKGIEACKVGKPYSGIGAAVKRHLDQFGFCSPAVNDVTLCYNVVVAFSRSLVFPQEYVGHGIGRMFHEPPDVIHTELPFNTEGLIEEGHVFTVEPVVCMGTDETVTWDDGWTVATADGLRSAQFEHTVAMTADGPIRLTGERKEKNLR